jgi:hypothetical protein
MLGDLLIVYNPSQGTDEPSLLIRVTNKKQIEMITQVAANFQH